MTEVTLSRQHEKYNRLITAAKNVPPLTTAVAHPCDETSLRGSLEAREAGLIIPILVGPKGKIESVAQAFSIDLGDAEIADAPHSHAAAEKAVELVRTGKAELLMKGSLHTDELLAEVVKRETGIRTGRRISHVFVMDVPGHPHTLFITDAAVNIAPDLDAKRDIIQNAIDLFAARCRRYRARRASSDHTDLARRQCHDTHGFLRRGNAFSSKPNCETAS